MITCIHMLHLNIQITRYCNLPICVIFIKNDFNLLDVFFSSTQNVIFSIFSFFQDNIYRLYNDNVKHRKIYKRNVNKLHMINEEISNVFVYIINTL